MVIWMCYTSNMYGCVYIYKRHPHGMRLGSGYLGVQGYRKRHPHGNMGMLYMYAWIHYMYIRNITPMIGNVTPMVYGYVIYVICMDTLYVWIHDI